ncbi:MAG: substrate-binding domain-containing protein [Pirellulales bacterium]
MNSQRIVLWAIAGIALLAAVGYNMTVFREPPPPPQVNIVFITGGSGPYWQRTVNGAKSAADEYDAKLDIEMPSVAEGVEEQTKLLEGLREKPVDGVAVSPLDAEGQTQLINALSKKTLLVTFDSDASDSMRQSHVGTTNFAAGRACARLVRDAIPDGGKIAVLVANSTKENIIDRRGAFTERINQYADDDVKEGDPLKYTIVGFYEDGGNAEKCAANIREVLKANPDLACLVGMNAQHGPTIMKVLKEDGQLDKVKVVAFDDAPATLQGVEDGHIFATLAQDSFGFGYEAVKILCNLKRGDAVAVPMGGRGAVFYGVEVVNKDNVAEFRQRMAEQLGAAEKKADAKKAKKAA